MYGERRTMWKKKGFYLSTCAALICFLAIGTVYYKMNSADTEQGEKLFADSAREEVANTGSPVGDSAVETDRQQKDNSQEKEDTGVAANAGQNSVVTPVPKQTASANKTTKKQETEKKTVAQKQQTAQDKTKGTTTNKKAEKNEKKDSVAAMADGSSLKFQVDKGLLWPVKGDILLGYSTNNTVYFKTLAQYRCNPAIAIAANIGTKVKAAADGVVKKVSEQNDIGRTVTMDIGSGYTVMYGQLQDITVKEGDSVKEGEVIGKIAQPTKYYSQEGSNLYFQVKENKETVDPLLLLR